MLIGSTILGTVGPIAEGVSANNAAKYTAEQERVAGNQAVGASQRVAYQERRKGNLVASRAQAVAAASGGGAADPTVVDIMGGIEAQTDYNVMTALYEGQETRRQYEASASLNEFEGKQALRGGIIRGAAQGLNTLSGPAGQNLLSGGTSLYEKYGKPTKPPVRKETSSGHEYEIFEYR